ncbi:hypothetical protein WCQ02_39295, partial [Paraburkholderia tropica]|uniref:hypothetical protein n=1 Tax=Paraburkholderia tropica TaxID=92647 RepID=UPI0030181F2B
STPMIVRIARVKVGNRQASYAVRPEPRFLQKESRGSGVWAWEKHQRQNPSRSQTSRLSQFAGTMLHCTLSSSYER